jgi:hypothetical protein
VPEIETLAAFHRFRMEAPAVADAVRAVFLPLVTIIVTVMAAILPWRH